MKEKILNFAKNNKLLTVAILLLVAQQVFFFYKEEMYKKRLELAQKNLGEAKVSILKHDEEIVLLDRELQEEINKKHLAVKELIEFRAQIKKSGKLTPNVKTVYEEKEVIVYTEPNTGIDVVPGRVYRATSKTTFRPLKSFTYEAEDDVIRLYALLTPDEDPDRYDPFKIQLEYALKLNIIGQIIKTVNEASEAYHLRLFHMKDGMIVGGIPTSDFAVTIKDMRNSKFRLWAPKLDIALSVSAGGVMDVKNVGGIGFSTSGYGLSDSDLTWRFLRVGAGLMSNGVGMFEFTPAMFNVGRVLPIINNLFIGPSLQTTAKKEKRLGFTIGVSL